MTHHGVTHDSSWCDTRRPLMWHLASPDEPVTSKVYSDRFDCEQSNVIIILFIQLGGGAFFLCFTRQRLFSHPKGNTFWRGRYGSCSHEPTATPQYINVYRVLRWRLWWHRANSACMQRLNGSMHATIRSLYRYMLCMSTCNYLWDGTWYCRFCDESSASSRVGCLQREMLLLCALRPRRDMSISITSKLPEIGTKGLGRKQLGFSRIPVAKVAMHRIENAPLPLSGDTSCFCPGSHRPHSNL